MRTQIQIKKLSALITLVYSILTIPTAIALDLPEHHPVPGGLALITLEVKTTQAPQVFYRDKRVMVVAHNQHWQAVVGIPLSAKKGQHQIKISSAGTTKTQLFSVDDKKYESQYITLKDKRKVDPNKQDLDRIWREKKEISAALRHWQNELLAQDLNLDIPVNGRLSSPFGLKRFFNNKPRRPHSGLDIAAPQGTPIRAPAAGKVIATGEYFFNGKTVFIDHGQGLISMYCHLHNIDSSVGDHIERGQIFASVGKTGRATGPHLHWSISLNDARIDPSLFININALKNRDL